MTFSGNRASGRDDALDNGESGAGGRVTISADIFAGVCSKLSGTWTDGGYNVATDSSCLHGGPGDVTDPSLATELGTLADNGGPTETILGTTYGPTFTMLPATGNPAIGAVPDPEAALCPVAADQRHIASASGRACDAGSVQSGGMATTTTTTTTPTTTTTTPTTTTTTPVTVHLVPIIIIVSTTVVLPPHLAGTHPVVRRVPVTLRCLRWPCRGVVAIFLPKPRELLASTSYSLARGQTKSFELTTTPTGKSVFGRVTRVRFLATNAAATVVGGAPATKRIVVS